jgi:hypothetical protein
MMSGLGSTLWSSCKSRCISASCHDSFSLDARRKEVEVHGNF